MLTASSCSSRVIKKLASFTRLLMGGQWGPWWFAKITIWRPTFAVDSQRESGALEAFLLIGREQDHNHDTAAHIKPAIAASIISCT